MKTIRNNVFETNSSTCHAVTICKKDTYQRYKKGELVCLVKVFIGQGVKAKISLCDDNFYDIDGFYNLIKKVRDFNKALPFSYRNYDFDAILNSSKKVIWRIFFNGERHYTSNKIQKSDILKAKRYGEMGYKVIRLPYFVQLSSPIIKLLFNIDINWEQQYPHGFIDEKAMLPVDYNYFGIHRFKEDLEKFGIIKVDIIQSLEAKIKLLGEDNVLPYGLKLTDF